MAVAQIAVALIGFGGVIAAPGRKGGEEWTPAQLLQLRTQIEPSLIALFGALVTGTLALVITSEDLLMRRPARHVKRTIWPNFKRLIESDP